LLDKKSGKNFSMGDGISPARTQSTTGILTTAKVNPSRDQYTSPSYKAEYERGLSYFQQKRYKDAISVFEQLLDIDSRTGYSDNAQYWIGESFYALRRYQEALRAFEKVFTFPNSNKNDYAQYKIAQCYYMLGNKPRANQEFQTFLNNYPNSELDSFAKRYLTRL
jgi:TolA-binding protein